MPRDRTDDESARKAGILTEGECGYAKYVLPVFDDISDSYGRERGEVVSERVCCSVRDPPHTHTRG